VTQIKTPEKDGYSAVQMGFGETRHLTKPERGHFEELAPRSSTCRKFGTATIENFQVGQKLVASLL